MGDLNLLKRHRKELLEELAVIVEMDVAMKIKEEKLKEIRRRTEAAEGEALQNDGAGPRGQDGTNQDQAQATSAIRGRKARDRAAFEQVEVEEVADHPPLPNTRVTRRKTVGYAYVPDDDDEDEEGVEDDWYWTPTLASKYRANKRPRRAPDNTVEKNPAPSTGKEAKGTGPGMGAVLVPWRQVFQNTYPSSAYHQDPRWTTGSKCYRTKQLLDTIKEYFAATSNACSETRKNVGYRRVDGGKKHLHIPRDCGADLISYLIEFKKFEPPERL